MAVKKHGVHFDVTAENATDRALRAVEDNLNGINKAAASVGLTLRSAFIATAAIAAGKAVTHAAIEAEQASKRLDAVLKATGHSAGLTKEQLDALAEAMAGSTQFDDTSLRNAAAQMLKFGNIHGDTFRQAMKLSADLAAFMGTDLQSAVQAVGKALTAPAEGLGALEKQIGKFNPAAEQMIKSLVEQGRQAQAQAAVLDLLKGKIGGAAEALNTGLFKGAEDMKKAWSSMLETIGKTEPFEKLGGGVLAVVRNYLVNIKDVIENGDWVEKTLAIAALVGGSGGHRQFKLTPREKSARNEMKGPILGAPAAMSLDQELVGAPMSERDIKSWKEMLAAQEKAREERKRRQEEQFRDDEKIARQTVDLADDEQRQITEAQIAWQNQRAENDKALAEGNAEMWKQVFETIDREQEEAIEQGRVMMDNLEDDAHAAQEAARQLGLTFSSAAEASFRRWEGFGKLIRSIGEDIAAMIFREHVTKPLAAGIGGLFKDFNFGKLFGGAGDNVGVAVDAAPGRAIGGPVAAGVPYMVGEHGPELLVPGASGAIIPNDILQRSGRGGRAGDTYIIDARGADQAGFARLEAMIRGLHGSIERRAIAAVRDVRLRGA